MIRQPISPPRHFSLAGLLRMLPVISAALFSANSQADVNSDAEKKIPEFRRVPPLASVREAARAAEFHLEGIAPARTGEMKAGDTATALVTWTEGRKLRQWLIEMKADDATGEERGNALVPMRFYTSTGNEFNLGAGRAALRLRMTGPLEKEDAGTGKAMKPLVESRRVLVSPDYLGLGLDRLPALTLRLDAARKANPAAKGVELKISDKPYPAEVVLAAKLGLARADSALKTDRADEIGFIGAMLAMREFFELANSTPGIQEVLRSVVDIPWWSVIRRGGGLDLNFTALSPMRELEAEPWGLKKDARVYALPFRLEINGKPALRLQLAVTRPRPPLIVSAGVVGLAAGAPDGKGPVLTFQIVSTRAGRLGK